MHPMIYIWKPKSPHNIGCVFLFSRQQSLEKTRRPMRGDVILMSLILVYKDFEQYGDDDSPFDMIAITESVM